VEGEAALGGARGAASEDSEESLEGDEGGVEEASAAWDAPAMSVDAAGGMLSVCLRLVQGFRHVTALEVWADLSQGSLEVSLVPAVLEGSHKDQGILLVALAQLVGPSSARVLWSTSRQCLQLIASLVL